MSPDSATTVAVVSAIIAGLALLWGVFTYFSTRKVAKLTYRISQISDFGVPESFLLDMPRAPVAVTVTSRGNKGTENIVLSLKTASPIEEIEVSPKDLRVSHVANELGIHCAKLNPSQQIKLFLRCAGPATENQVTEVELSHSEGKGVDEYEVTTIKIDLMGIGLEYDTRNLATHVSRIGPFSLKG